MGAFMLVGNVVLALVMPPSKKLPPMLMAAVCHAANLARVVGC
jgi:hypothetical protein